VIFTTWFIFIIAASFEVAGVAVLRNGLKGSSLVLVLAGVVLLSCYGMVVGSVKWDLSKVLGLDMAVFAVISVLTSRFLFSESISAATWIGLSVIVAGGVIIQIGDYSR
jgi:small multidrug resistance family-3 protein